MKVPLHVVKARRERLAQLLQQQQYLPITELCQKLDVSEATARRDLAALAREKVITRTYGGALCDYNQRFPSFRERQYRALTSKQRIALAARAQLRPGQTCFFDSGTTVYAVAEVITARPVENLTVVTNNLPVAEVLADTKSIDVELLGGQYLARQSILLGETARRSLRLWKFDVAFLGAEGMTRAGVWNSQQDVVKFQRAVVAMTPRVFFCLDATKLGQEASEFLLPWAEVHCLVTDAARAELKAAGIQLNRSQLIEA